MKPHYIYYIYGVQKSYEEVLQLYSLFSNHRKATRKIFSIPKTEFNASVALRQLPFDVSETHFTSVDSVSIKYANEPLFLLNRNLL